MPTNTNISFIAITLLFWGVLFTHTARGAEVDGSIHVSILENKALYLAVGSTEWVPLKPGDPIYPGDEVQTLQGTRLVVTLGDGSEVRIAENSHFRLNPETSMTDQNFDFQLYLGKAWAHLRKNVYRSARLIIRTAQAKIDIQGTSYEAQANAAFTDVLVFSGKVKVSNQSQRANPPPLADGEIAGPQEIEAPQEVTLAEWQLIVGAFYRVRVGHTAAQPQPEKFSMAQVSSDWVSWNLERDK
ncbi:MAG: FecR domain-containing protein [SAR324 cluster bacterium]|nr:FecR domain-containing protein [SAR324 cluster bacterium]